MNKNLNLTTRIYLYSICTSLEFDIKNIPPLYRACKFREQKKRAAVWRRAKTSPTVATQFSVT